MTNPLIDPQQVREIAAIANADYKTVTSHLRGVPGRPGVRARIERAMDVLGIPARKRVRSTEGG